MRTVPDHIERPDYADHPEGFPASERAVRGSTNIVTLSDEDQEEMRTAGRVRRRQICAITDSCNNTPHTDIVLCWLDDFGQMLEPKH